LIIFATSSKKLMSEVPKAEPKKSNKAAVAIALLSIIVIIQSVKIYLDYKEKIVIREEKSTVEQELGTTMQRLTEIRAELDTKIAEITRLGGDVEELKKAKAEVEAELKSVRKRNDKAIADLKDRVEGYEELLKLKEQGALL
jgi:regulator of replication initiation timing